MSPANDASPGRALAFAQIRLWLEKLGVKSFRYGWFQPGEDGAGACSFPLAAFVPDEGARFDPSGNGSYRESETIKIILWFEGDGDTPYSKTYGGWTKVWEFHDQVFAGANSVGQFFPQFGTAQFIIEPTRWEDYWFLTDGLLAAELTIETHIRIGPEFIQ